MIRIALIGFVALTLAACAPAVHDMNQETDFSSFMGPTISSNYQNRSDINLRDFFMYFEFEIDALLSKKSATCKVDSQPAVDCKSGVFAVSNLADGDHLVTVTLVDSLGQSANPLTVPVRVDTVVPTVQLTQTPSAFTGRMTTVAFMGNDNASGLAGHVCSFDNGAFVTCASPLTLNNLANGAHNLRVRAIDKANNASAILTANWTVNNAAPVITITNRPLENTMNRNASFSFNGVLDGAAVTQFQCSLDGAAFAACTSPMNYANLADGQHSFRVQGRNNNNEFINPVTITWRVDNIAPTTPVITTNVPALSTVATATFMFTADDNNSGVASYQCSLDGAAFAACTSPMSYANLTEGAHQFAVRAIDRAGNVSAPALFNWTIDLP